MPPPIEIHHASTQTDPIALSPSPDSNNANDPETTTTVTKRRTSSVRKADAPVQLIEDETTTTTTIHKHGSKFTFLRYKRFWLFSLILAAILGILYQPIEEAASQTREKYVDPFVERLALPNFAVSLEMGRELRSKGFKKKHPIVMVPGFITSALEVWEGLECAQESNARSQVWGGFEMMKRILMDKNCWLQHMMLHPESGLDPEGIRIRGGEGIKSVDYFITGYFVFAPLIDNLGVLGWDVHSLHVATYDWRLSFFNMEHRDRHFTRLKMKIESMRIIEGEKVVVLCHSLGAVQFYNFMQWVKHTQPNGEEWLNENVESYVDIAGPLLGVPKAISALLSGEMRDTAQFGALQKYILNPFFTLEQRALLFRSWNSDLEMLVKGSSKLWRDLVVFDPEYNVPQNVSIENLKEFLSESTDEYVKSKLTRYDLGYRTDFTDPAYNSSDPSHWSNPLASQLPNAPDMKVYCMYGFGKSTEVGYFYKPAANASGLVKYEMDFLKMSENDSLSFGVFSGDGDGTVPLVSLGYPCAKLWRKKSHNPAGIKVVSREYKHSPLPIWEDVRGGTETSDHVDILNNKHTIRDVIYIATGHGDELEDQILSEIDTFPDL